MLMWKHMKMQKLRLSWSSQEKHSICCWPREKNWDLCCGIVLLWPFEAWFRRWLIFLPHPSSLSLSSSYLPESLPFGWINTLQKRLEQLALAKELNGAGEFSCNWHSYPIPQCLDWVKSLLCTFQYPNNMHRRR